MNHKIKVNFSHPAFQFLSIDHFNSEWDFALNRLLPEEDGAKISRGVVYIDSYNKLQFLKHSFIKIDNTVFALSSNPQHNYIGEGSFGIVRFAINKDSILYAMKVQQIDSFGIYASKETVISWDLGLLEHIPSSRIKLNNQLEPVVCKLYMPLLYKGPSLQNKLLSEKISPSHALNLAIDIAIALHRLHTACDSQTGQAYVHHDLKPANILLTSKHHATLVDFGFSSLLSQSTTPIRMRGTDIYLPFGGKYADHLRLPKESNAIVRHNMQLLGPEGVDNFAAKRVFYIPHELRELASSNRKAPRNSFQKKGLCLLTPHSYKQLPTRLQEILYTADYPNKSLDVLEHKQHTALFLAAFFISFQKKIFINIPHLENKLLLSVERQKSIVNKYLKKKSLPLLETSSLPSTALHNLINTGDIKQLIMYHAKYQPLLNSRNDKGETPLITAAMKGDIRFLKTLCYMKAKLNSQDNYGWTALFTTVVYNHENALNLLLHYGANVNIPNRLGITPLIKAVIHKNQAILQMLLSSRALKINQFDYLRRTAVHFAVADNNLEGLKALYEAGADLNFPDINGLTPIFVAMPHNSLSSFIFLIEHNTPINQKNYAGESLLFVASFFNRSKMVEILLEKKAVYKEDNISLKALQRLIPHQDKEATHRMDDFIYKTLSLDEDTLSIPMTPADIAWIKGNDEVFSKLKTIPLMRFPEKNRFKLNQEGFFAKKPAKPNLHKNSDNSHSEWEDISDFNDGNSSPSKNP